MPVNPTIEAILAKLDDVIAAQPDNTLLVAALEANTAVLTNILSVLENTYEKVNTMEFNVGLSAERLNLIEGWDVGAKLGELLDLYNNTLGPLAEAAQFNEREIIANLRILSCLCDVSLLPLGPAPALLPPSSAEEHCRRVAYFIGHTVLRISEVQRLIDQGIQLGNDTIAYLFGFNVVLGIDESIVPADIRLGLAGLLAQGAAALLESAKAWLVSHTDALRDLIYGTAHAAAAKEAVDAYIDTELPGAGNIILNQTIKLLLNQGALNVIFDQDVVWDTSEYAAVECGPAESFSILPSLHMNLVESTAGPGMVDMMGKHWRSNVNALPDSHYYMISATYGATVYAIRESDYSPTGDINLAVKYTVFSFANLNNYRIKLDEPSVGDIWLVDDDVNEFQLNTTTWQQFPNRAGLWSIQGTLADAGFWVRIQELVGGVWQAPF